jgi:hypothetical protein
MLVYGDLQRRTDPRALLRAIEARATGCCEFSREQLTTLLLDAGELAQGLIDSEFEASEVDHATPLVTAATALVREVAARFVGGQRTLVFDTLGKLALPEHVTISLPEGFAFYATYPEAWARAAERFRGTRTRVIGIRSIGLTLGAVVAAAAASERFVSVRPIGPPFDRVLALGPSLERVLLEDDSRVIYLVVDEGPGLSGSSFASVASWLLARGMAPDRIVFMPSHGGEPGIQASPAIRQIWATTRRVLPVTKAVYADGEEFGGGKWRCRVYGDHPWPPANPQQERCKVLLREHGTLRLAKFAGLGRYGAEKLELARTLAASGWTTRPLELANGYMVSGWLADALPLDHPSAKCDRTRLISRVSEYIMFRSTELLAHDCPGASVETLFTMLLTNCEDMLGTRLWAWGRALGEIAEALAPRRTDNRMHRWEWLLRPDGTILKSDAVDHHATHDLVGAQDPLWDLVGARHELALDDAEFSMLHEQVARQLDRRWTTLQIEFFSAAYLAFQYGAATLAAQTAPEADARRLRRAARRYARALTTIAPSGR